MDNVIEAYELTLEKIEELKSEGIEVEIVPSKSRDNPVTVEKYDNPGRLPPEKWIHVTFKVENVHEAKAVHKMANYLGMAGIRFDSGGMSGCRDWELDWSFQYKPGEANEEWREAREDVEDIITGLGGDQNP